MFADRTNWNLKPNRLSETLLRHRAAGRPVLDLSVSNPTECGLPGDGEIILSALHQPGALTYKPDPMGLEVARQAIAGYYAARGESVAAQDILITTGTSEGYSFVFRLLCNPGDEVLIPAPGYPLFDFLADIHDVKLVRYPLLYDHGWQLDFHALEQATTQRTRGVIVVHPNNPTGHFCKPEEIAKLKELCSARQIALIADEVFLDFAIGAERRESFATNGEALTFTLSGLSKMCGLPQMKVGWVVTTGPEKWKKEALARLEVIADAYLSQNTPMQLATPAFLEQRNGFQKKLLARVRSNVAELDRQLAAQKCCKRLEVEGGWNAVLRVPATRPDEELAIELLEKQNVLVHPGHFYDFPGNGYLIVSLITPEQEFVDGIRRILSPQASE